VNNGWKFHAQIETISGSGHDPACGMHRLRPAAIEGPLPPKKSIPNISCFRQMLALRKQITRRFVSLVLARVRRVAWRRVVRSKDLGSLSMQLQETSGSGQQKRRAPGQKRIYSFIASIAREQKIPLLAAGGMPNHSHLLFLLPATISLASAINTFKLLAVHA
jgi:hypothetical protein